MAGLTRIVARNSAFGLGAQVGLKGLSFVFSVVVLRFLGAEAFGQYAAVLAFGAMFVFLADLGLSPYVVRQVARLRANTDGARHIEELYGSVLRLRVLLAAFASVAAIGAAILTDRPPAMVIAVGMSAIGLMLYSVQGASDAVLAGLERLDLSSLSKLLNQAVFVVAGAGALWLGLGYHGLIIANVLGAAVAAVYCARTVARLGVKLGPAAFRNWPSLLRASIPFGIIGFTLGLSYKFDSVLLNVTRGDAETGYYNAAYNLVFSAVILSNVFNTALYPSLARRAAAGRERLGELYEQAVRYLMMLSLPIAVGIGITADRLVPALFTEAYLPAVPVLQIVIWTVPLMFMSEFLGYQALILGLERRCARAVVISTGLNVAANLILVPRFGLLAAAGMTVLTEAVLVGQYVGLLRHALAGLAWNRALVRPLLAAMAMGMVVFAARDLPLGVDILLGAAAYAALLLAMGLIGPEELRIFKDVRRKQTPVSAGIPGPDVAESPA